MTGCYAVVVTNDGEKSTGQVVVSREEALALLGGEEPTEMTLRQFSTMGQAKGWLAVHEHLNAKVPREEALKWDVADDKSGNSVDGTTTPKSDQDERETLQYFDSPMHKKEEDSRVSQLLQQVLAGMEALRVGAERTSAAIATTNSNVEQLRQERSASTQQSQQPTEIPRKRATELATSLPKSSSVSTLDEMAKKIKLESMQAHQSTEDGLREQRRKQRGANDDSGSDSEERREERGGSRHRVASVVVARETKEEARRRRTAVLEYRGNNKGGGEGAETFDAAQDEHPFDGHRMAELRAVAVHKQFHSFEMDMSECVRRIQSQEGLIVCTLDGSVNRIKMLSHRELLTQQTKAAGRRNVTYEGTNLYLTMDRCNPDASIFVDCGPQMGKDKPRVIFPVTFIEARQFVDKAVRDVSEGNTFLSVGNRKLLPENVAERCKIMNEFRRLVFQMLAQFDSIANPIAKNKNKVVIQLVVCMFVTHQVTLMSIAPGDLVFELENGTDRLTETWKSVIVPYIQAASVDGSDDQLRVFTKAAFASCMCCVRCGLYCTTMATCTNGECKALNESAGKSDAAIRRQDAETAMGVWCTANGRTSSPPLAADEQAYTVHMRVSQRGWKMPPKANATTAAINMDPFKRFAACQHLIPCPQAEVQEDHYLIGSGL
jgi:hypothetical protein